MTTEHKSRLAHVPSILAGSAALIAAVTTLYVNLRESPAKDPVPAVTAPATASASVAGASDASVSAASKQPRRVLLRLDRVQVDNDGSFGATDWTFQASLEGQPVFSVAMPSLSDKPGENLARPETPREASAEVELPLGKNVELSVNGWQKKGWLPGARAEITGKAWIAAGFNKTSITLKSGKPKGPQFVLYFSAVPAE